MVRCQHARDAVRPDQLRRWAKAAARNKHTISKSFTNPHSTSTSQNAVAVPCDGCVGALGAKSSGANARRKKTGKAAKRKQKQAQLAARKAQQTTVLQGSMNGGIWICLSCAHVGCGRYSEQAHAVKHFERNGEKHALAVQFATLNVWCYACDAEIDIADGVGSDYALAGDGSEDSARSCSATASAVQEPPQGRDGDFSVDGPTSSVDNSVASSMRVDSTSSANDGNSRSDISRRIETDAPSGRVEAPSEFVDADSPTALDKDAKVSAEQRKTEETDDRRNRLLAGLVLPSPEDSAFHPASTVAESAAEESWPACPSDGGLVAKEQTHERVVADMPTEETDLTVLGGTVPSATESNAVSSDDSLPRQSAIAAFKFPGAHAISECVEIIRSMRDKEVPEAASSTDLSNFAFAREREERIWRTSGGSGLRKEQKGRGAAGRKGKLTLNSLKEDTTPLFFSSTEVHQHRESSHAGSRGLQNNGNTCFFNSIAQCLTQSAPLRAYLDRQIADSSSDTADVDDTVTVALHAFLRAMWADDESNRGFSTFNPRHFFLQLCKKAPTFYGWQQQDSHEFLVYLLDVLDVEARKHRLSSQDARLAEGKENKLRLADSDHLETTEPFNCVRDIFGMKIVSTVTCCECSHQSRVTEEYNHLSLSIDLGPSTKMKANSGRSSLSYSDRLLKEIASLEGQRKLTKRAAKRIKQLREQLARVQGNVSSSSSEPSESEAVEADSALSVESCLRHFSKIEKLDSRNKVFCEACTKRMSLQDRNGGAFDEKSNPADDQDGSEEDDNHSKNGESASKPKLPLVYTKSTKQLLLSADSTPPILVLHLKRFMQTTLGLRKDDTFVEFSEYLDLSRFLDDPERSVKYRLCGVSVHCGGMGGGHYVGYVRHNPIAPLQHPQNTSGDRVNRAVEDGPRTAEWFYMSDAHVSPTTVSEVLRSEAYVLFYEKL